MQKVLLVISVMLLAAFSAAFAANVESEKKPETPFTICKLLGTCDIED